ncbi:MAG: hypothetical protein M3167_18910 [Acidobacteriota bacterium]|nr:hypothetical protein [Acidobacteriota bacterium]
MRIRNVFFYNAAAGLAIFWTACASSPPPPSPPPTSAPRPAEGSAAVRAPVTPAMLAGNWLFEVKMGGRSVEGSLHFAVTSGVLAGTFTRSDGNEQELKNIEIKENVVAWDVEGGGGKQHAKATVDGSSMKGTLKHSGGGRGGKGGSSPNGETGDSGGDSAGAPSGGGGRRGGGGGRGGGGRRGGGGGTTEVTFIAYKSVPPVETGAPILKPTPGS